LARGEEHEASLGLYQGWPSLMGGELAREEEFYSKYENPIL